MRRLPPIQTSLALAPNSVIGLPRPMALSCRAWEHPDFDELDSAEQTSIGSPVANQVTG